MAKKVTVDTLAEEINKIIKEYENDVSVNMDQIVTKIGKKGVQALKNESLDMFPDSKKHKKRYGTTWKATAEKGRLYTKVIIHNTQAGFPHLLEFGHAVYNGTGRCGGKARAFPHVATVEQKLIVDLEKEVVAKL